MGKKTKLVPMDRELFNVSVDMRFVTKRCFVASLAHHVPDMISCSEKPTLPSSSPCSHDFSGIWHFSQRSCRFSKKAPLLYSYFSYGEFQFYSTAYCKCIFYHKNDIQMVNLKNMINF